MRDIDQALARAYGLRGKPAQPRPTGALPTPHFPVEPIRQGRPEPDGPGDGTVGLSWPETVRILEREHGDRFEELADALIEVRDERRLKVLLFTSCHRAEGRTSLVLAVARALARRPGRTLLVDADLTGPMLARQLGLRPRFGLDDLVDSGVAFAEAIIEAPDDNLSVLPLRAAVARPREFLASAGWSCTMARLRREYDLVLLDGSPLFAGLSAAVLHSSVDAAILVRNRSLTGERALLRAREVLDAGGIPLLGMAETFV
jgi:protein-tyrosine kinase